MKLLILISTLLFMCGCKQSYEPADLSPEGFNQNESSSELPNPQPSEPEDTLSGQFPEDWPQFDWDGKHGDSELWNEFSYKAMADLGSDLLENEPADIKTFCPAYENLNKEGQVMFWISLVAAMTRYESSFNPATSYQENFKDQNGEYIVSRGLLQLSIESGRGYGCPLESALSLHDPETNLRCGIRILNRWVGRDGLITGKSSSGSWRGGARYWAVLRKTSTLQGIIEKTKNNSLCQN